MKLSDNTLEILKNFAAINQGLVIKPGSTVRTISSNKAILAEANVAEKFPNELGIYDLHKVLSVVDKNSPEVDFGNDSMTFSSVGKIRIRYTASSLILSPPNKNINIPSYDVSISLSEEILNWIFSMAAVLKCPNIVIKSDGKNSPISIWAMDVKGEIVDDACVEVDGECDSAFQAVLKVENLKVIHGEYAVDISSAGVSRFKNKTKDLTYWIAIEQASSTFAKE